MAELAELAEDWGELEKTVIKSLKTPMQDISSPQQSE